MYQYNCKIIEIIDGDTVKVDIDVGFNIWMNNMVIRLLGILEALGKIPKN